MSKKNFKDTKFGQFLSKAGQSIPEILSVGGEILTGDVGGAVEKVGAILKGKAETSAEAAKLLQEFELAKMSYKKDIFELEIEDRKSARLREAEYVRVGKTDWMQVITGITGLGAFIFCIYAVTYIANVQENKLFVHLMGMIEGVVVGGIFAYYFGTSKSSKDKDILK